MATIETRLAKLETTTAKSWEGSSDREAMLNNIYWLRVMDTFTIADWPCQVGQQRSRPAPPARSGDTRVDEQRQQLFDAEMRSYDFESEVLDNREQFERDLKSYQETDAWKSWYQGNTPAAGW